MIRMERVSEHSAVERQETKQEYLHPEVFEAIFNHWYNLTHNIRDFYRIGLADLGGGLMGVQSAGMLTAFELLKIRPETFDEMVGVSAGGANLACYRAGQIAEQTQIYYEFLTKEPGRVGLISPTNIRRPVDVKKMLQVMRPGGVSPLDLKKLLSCPGKFEVVVTDIDSEKPEYLPVRTGKTDLNVLRLIHATAAVEAKYGRIIHIGGRRYIDGSFIDSIPIEKMKADSLTHVLILPNYGLEEMKANADSLPVRILDRLYYSKRLPRKLRKVYLNHQELQRQEFEGFEMLYNEGKKPKSTCKIAAIQPVFRKVDHIGFRNTKKSITAAVENCMMTIELLWKARESYLQKYPERRSVFEDLCPRKPSYEEVVRALTTKKSRGQGSPVA